MMSESTVETQPVTSSETHVCVAFVEWSDGKPDFFLGSTSEVAEKKCFDFVVGTQSFKDFLEEIGVACVESFAALSELVSESSDDAANHGIMSICSEWSSF
jgi:hypothetical protein